MPAPLIAAGVIGALQLLKMYSDYQGAEKQQAYGEDQINFQKKEARRGAIERSLSSKYSSPIGGRRPEPPKPPNLTSQGIVGGLSNLGSVIAGRYL